MPILTSVISAVHELAFWQRYASKTVSWLNRRRERQVIDAFIAPTKRIDIVVPEISIPAYKSAYKEEDNVSLPGNATLIPYGDAQNIIILMDHFRVNYGRRKEIKYYSAESHPKRGGINYIAVGGQSVNGVTRYFLVENNVPGVKMALESVEAGHLDWVVRINRYAGNVSSEMAFKPKRRYGASDEHNVRSRDNSPISEDYGFIVFLNPPDRDDQMVLLLFGLWPFGTEAAAKVVTGYGSPDRRKEMTRHVLSKQNFIAVIRVGVRGHRADDPVIDEVITLGKVTQLPRTAS